jgi:hypothetical protein
MAVLHPPAERKHRKAGYAKGLLKITGDIMEPMDVK